MRERSTKNFPSKTDNGKRMFLATHFVNHKRQSCQDNYNPNKVKEVVPEANLMCAVAEMQKTLSTIVLFFHQLC